MENLNRPIKKIIIIGGGTAGWLSAGIIAAQHLVDPEHGIELTLIESPNTPILGVGEGTWPSMRSTLKKIGIHESEFIKKCDASFKQGSKFIGWKNHPESFYYHPFSLPIAHDSIDLSQYWATQRDKISFADAVNIQGYLDKKHLAPKQLSSDDYAFSANYGYHLDANKIAQFLKKHCCEKLGVNCIIDDVMQVNTKECGDIDSVITSNNGHIAADLFIDCTGNAALLIGQHFKIPFISKRDVLFNDAALASQVEYDTENSNISSFTKSTAQSDGWVWDIGLYSRRGVGYTYSSAHTTDDQAEQILSSYIQKSTQAPHNTSIRKLSFEPGHRAQFWHRNCIAIGVSAGFIEPLEASAIALIELSATMLSEQLPENRACMDTLAKRFNAKFLGRWDQIVEFLKLHYVLTDRTDSAYWCDNQNFHSTLPELSEKLALWKHHPVSKYDSTQKEELFPVASYQYILYGMGFYPREPSFPKRINHSRMAEKLISQNIHQAKHLTNHLPSNRELLKNIREKTIA